MENNNISNTTSSDYVEPSVDEIFGDIHDDEDSNGGTNTGVGVTTEQTSAIPPTDAPTTISGDTDWEKLAKQFQSNYDKTKAEYEKLNSQVQELSGAAEFVNNLYEDEQLRRAFIAEVEPDLVKPKDLQTYIQEGLAKEFGEDFVPDPDEERRYGSKSWLYSKRAEELYKDYSTSLNTKVPESVKSLREKRLQEAKQRQEAIEKEKKEILESFKWGDSEYNNFINWASKLTAKDIAKVYNYSMKAASKKRGSVPPSPTGFPGGKGVSDDAYMKHLNDMFG